MGVKRKKTDSGVGWGAPCCVQPIREILSVGVAVAGGRCGGKRLGEKMEEFNWAHVPRGGLSTGKSGGVGGAETHGSHILQGGTL